MKAKYLGGLGERCKRPQRGPGVEAREDFEICHILFAWKWHFQTFILKNLAMNCRAYYNQNEMVGLSFNRLTQLSLIEP